MRNEIYFGLLKRSRSSCGGDYEQFRKTVFGDEDITQELSRVQAEFKPLQDRVKASVNIRKIKV